MRTLVLLVLLACGLVAHGQSSQLNLDFEPEVNQRRPLLFWTYPTLSDKSIQVDSSVAKRGRGSLLLHIPETDSKKHRVVMTYAIAIDSVRGKLLTVRGYMRTAGFKGRAGLYAVIYGTGAADILVRVDSTRQVAPNQEWQQIELQFPVPTASSELLVGFQGQGTGRVWFDAMELMVGTQSYGKGQIVGSEALGKREDVVLDGTFENFSTYVKHSSALQFDSVNAPQGRRSLRVVSNSQPAPFLFLGAVPIAPKHLGRALTIKGYARQLSTAAPIQLYAAVLLKENFVAGIRKNAARRISLEVVTLPVVGKEWQPFALTIPLPVGGSFGTGAQLVLSIGTRGTSPGQYGLDDVQLSIHGEALAGSFGSPSTPSAAELAWLRQAVIPLPLASPVADMAPLLSLSDAFRAARVVGLGQVTYGSHEILQQKHRLFRFLVEQKGFHTLVLDADMSACEQLDNYLQTGQGNVLQLLASLGLGWSSDEVHSLIQWMRAYNLRSSGNKLKLVGMSINQPAATLVSLSRCTYLQNPESRDLLTKLQLQLDRLVQVAKQPKLEGDTGTPIVSVVLEPFNTVLKGVENQLDLRMKVGGKSEALDELNWRRQQLRLLNQFAVSLSLDAATRRNYQAASQAENIKWLISLQLLGKMAIWSHNQNVAKTNEHDRPLGQWLRNAYGKEYVAIGFAFHEGKYLTEEAQVVTAQASTAGVSEYWFHSLAMPAFVLPLQSATSLNENNAWLFQKRLFRDILYRQPSTDFHTHDLRNEFDLLVFIDKSTPSTATTPSN